MALCTTLTVVGAIPVITLVDKGFGVDGAPIQDTCTRNDIIGKTVQLALRLTADKNAYADITITYKDPAETAYGSLYTNTAINSGTYNYLFIPAPDTYYAGTWAVGTVNISNIRTR